MSEATTHQDPVCGMTVKSGSEADHVEHDGATYFFCSSQRLARRPPAS